MGKNDARRSKVSDRSKSRSKRNTICVNFIDAKPSGSSAEKSLQIWKREVAALSSGTFESLADAVECIVEQVGKRMNASAEEMEFLRTAIETDPMLLEELRKQFTFRRP